MTGVVAPRAGRAGRAPAWLSVAATALALFAAFLCVGWIASIDAFAEVFRSFGTSLPWPTAWATGHAAFVDFELAGAVLGLVVGTGLHWRWRSRRSARGLMLGACAAILVAAILFGVMYLPILALGRVE